MTNDDWRVQASFKFGPNQSAMLNVRAMTMEELDRAVREISNVVGTLVVAGDLLVAESAETGRAAGVVARSFPGASVVGTQSYAAPQNSAPASPYPPCGPNGSHGSRVERSGAKNGKAWTGYFCPLPQGATGKCDPIFV